MSNIKSHICQKKSVKHVEYVNPVTKPVEKEVISKIDPGHF